jgi:hypothetical protein
VKKLTGFASGRGAVKTVGDESASTGSTKGISNNVSTLRVTVDNNVSARALGVEGSDLRLTVAGTLSELSAVVSTLGNVELDVDVVAGLALGSELAAGRVNEGCGTAVMVRSVVAAGHEDDYIGTCCVELGRSCLRRGESSESANGDGVTDEGHDYGLRLYSNYKRMWVVILLVGVVY